MLFLLDTNVISDLMKGHKHVQKQVSLHQPKQLAFSSTTVMEIEAGLEKKPEMRQKYQADWQATQDDMSIIPFDIEEARQTAKIRQWLASKETPLGPYDLQIAGTALARGLTLVTHNTGEFSRVPFLRLVDWRVNK